MKLSDLQSKKVISVTTGRNMGNIVDCDVLEDGRIESLFIEMSKGVFSLNKESDARVYWQDITKIGEDVILVKKS